MGWEGSILRFGLFVFYLPFCQGGVTGSCTAVDGRRWEGSVWGRWI